MPSEHIRCSSLLIKEIEIKTTTHHFKAIRMATIKRQMLAKMWKNWNPPKMMEGMLNGVAALENSLQFL